MSVYFSKLKYQTDSTYQYDILNWHLFCEETKVEIWKKLNKKRADNFISGHLISIRHLVSLLFQPLKQNNQGCTTEKYSARIELQIDIRLLIER